MAAGDTQSVVSAKGQVVGDREGALSSVVNKVVFVSGRGPGGEAGSTGASGIVGPLSAALLWPLAWAHEHCLLWGGARQEFPRVLPPVFHGPPCRSPSTVVTQFPLR